METLKGPKGSRVLNPTLQISPMRYTAKGKPAAQGALLPALPSRGEKILHNHFVGDGGRYQKQDREDQEKRTLDSGSPSGVQPQQECQAHVLHLRRGKQEKEAEWEPGRAAISAPAAAASPLGYTHQGQPGHGPIRHRNEGKAPPTTRILSTLTVQMEMHQGRYLHSS